MCEFVVFKICQSLFMFIDADVFGEGGRCRIKRPRKTNTKNTKIQIQMINIAKVFVDDENNFREVYLVREYINITIQVF